MEESQLRAELGFLKSLKRGILNALGNLQQNGERFISVAKRLWEGYNRAYPRMSDLLEYVSSPSNGKFEDWIATLYILLPYIDRGIVGIEAKISPLPGKEAIELRALKDEFDELLKNMPIEYKTNINEAIKECEIGSFLGSALISSRIIGYIFEQIPGKDIDGKIENLKNKGLIEPKGEIPSEYIIKADKKARNYLSHNLSASASCSDALELLGICRRLSKLLKDYQRS